MKVSKDGQGDAKVDISKDESERVENSVCKDLQGTTYFSRSAGSAPEGLSC